MINNSGATPPRAPASCSIWRRDAGSTGRPSRRAAAGTTRVKPLPPPRAALSAAACGVAAVAGRAAACAGPGHTAPSGGTVCALPGVWSGCLRPRRVSRGGTTRSHPGTVGTWLGPQPCARASADLGPGRRGTRALLRRALTGSARFDALRSVSPSSKCLCLFPFHEVMKLEKPVCADPPQWSSWVAFTGRRPFAVTSWGQRCPSCFSRGPPLTDGEPG